MNSALLNRDTGDPPRLRSNPTIGTRHRARHVLVVEDDEALRNLTAMALAKAGYEVDTAEDGEAGWDALNAAHYDLLVTDHDMPRLTGLQLVERLRLAGLAVPAIMVSGSHELGAVDDHPGLALEAVLHKPFPFTELIAVARRAAPVAAEACPGSIQNLHGRRQTAVAMPFEEHTQPGLRAAPETARSRHNRPNSMNTLTALPEFESADFMPVSEIPAPAFPPAPLRTSRAPKRVLIVDDDEVVRTSLAAVLECEGYEVHSTDDGNSAIRLAVDHRPDLVLLDLNMPKMDGWTAFTELEGARPLLPVIVLTARPNQYKNAVKLGVDAFMEKPLNFPVLLRAIRKLTQEPPEKHVRRIISSGFVTRLLDNQTQAHS